MRWLPAGAPGLAAMLAVASALAVCAVLLLGAQPAPQGVLMEAGRDQALISASAPARVRGGFTMLHEEDDLSEAELAGRLAHAIDAHEKCRRHWPHLEKLESAQEIRVHDARNNLEVANRAMERARKELRDAEGLVLAARQEHQAYEAQRVAFQNFKSEYDAQASMKAQNPAVQLHERSRGTSMLSASVQSALQLQADASKLELEQNAAMELESRKMAQLKERTAEELASSMPARTQDLAQVYVKGPTGPTPILSQVRSGIVVPGNSELRVQQSKLKRKARVAQANQASKLIHEEATYKAEEVKAFAELPSEEKLAKGIARNLARHRRKEDLERSRILVTGRRMRYLERREADDTVVDMAKKVQLAKAQHELAKVSLRITAHKVASEKKELAALKQDERQGPADSEKLSAVEKSLHRLRTHHRLVALVGKKARETELALVPRRMDVVALMRGKRGTRRKAASANARKPAAKSKKESRAQLRKEVEESRRKLKLIRDHLLEVQSRLAAEEQMDPAAVLALKRVRGQVLSARHHDVKRQHQILRDSHAQPTMALYNVYEEKLTALREERKKADGLLAKAERMLNIARIDSLHAAKTKKAALEELKYATSKLRRYQDLRSKSQHCQMDAWSEIRELTHRARRNKMLEGKDVARHEALKDLVPSVL